MNIFSLLGFKDGAFDRNPLAAAFAMPNYSHRGGDYWRRFSGKSKTFKRNKRRGL